MEWGNAYYSGPVYKVKSFGNMTPKALYDYCVKDLERQSGSIAFKPHWGRACNDSLPLKPWDFTWGKGSIHEA